MQIGKHSAILLICSFGLDRSLCLKRELVFERHYRDVINIGIHTTDKDIQEILGAWADLIIVIADDSVWNVIPFDLRGKAIYKNIGKDIWNSPEHPELKKICKRVADELGL